MTRKYEVIENNGGGLLLAIFDEAGNVSHLFSGYEYNPENLKIDIAALADGDPDDWEGCAENPQAEYDYLVDGGPAYCHIIADNDGVYTKHMGFAGAKAFGIELD